MNLRIGAKGKNVVDLQNLLNNKVIPRPNLRTDGEFGQKTRNAVIQFQHSNWLVGDGIVGPCMELHYRKGKVSCVAPCSSGSAIYSCNLLGGCNSNAPGSAITGYITRSGKEINR